MLRDELELSHHAFGCTVAHRTEGAFGSMTVNFKRNLEKYN